MSVETASQPRIKIAWLVGAMAAFALFAIIAAYSSRMTWEYTDYDQEQAALRRVNLADVQKVENALICPVDDKGKPTAEWVDQDKGVVRIPIEEAMVREIDTLKAQPLQAGGEIPGAAPAPEPAAPASTNAAPEKPAAPATPAKPAKPAKPIKTTLLSPNQPVFKTRQIQTKVFIRNGSGDIFAIGTLIPAPTDDISATPAVPAATPTPTNSNP